MATRQKPARDWYSISVSSLRRGFTLIGLVLALILSILAYQRWQLHSQRVRAEWTLAEATQLARDLERRPDFEEIFVEHRTAWKDLEDARAAFSAERYRAALGRARSSLAELETVLAGGQGGAERKSRFLSIQGSVEYRRGERGSWTKARTNDTLNPGDWVKTSAEGTAEIRLPDGTTYILRRNTMMRLSSILEGSSGEQVADLRFGWVEFNTAQGRYKVKTPGSEAKLERGTEGKVTYTPESEEGQYRAYEGGIQVTSTSGQTREMGALQQVDQQGAELSPPKAVLPHPQLVAPANNQEVDFDTQREVRLAWRPIPDARRYALNVSRSQIFAANIIEDDDRRKTSARVGIRGEGIFFWRVAAYAPDGTLGAWSEPRSFRVASLRGAGDVDDTTPPPLQIEDVQTYGSLVLVNGRTEPGATVEINEEPVSVELDGSFSKTIQMTQVGFAFIQVVSTDAWDNSSEVKRRVFIDTF